MTAQPFPFAALPAISREEIRVAARIRSASTTFVRPEAVAASLAELTGEPVSIAVRRTRPLDAANIPPNGVGVAFSPADAPGLSHAVLVDVEAALAATLVARGLRQRAPRVIDASRPPSAEVAGALAALLHTALRRAHAGVPLRVVAAGPGAALARDLAGVHGRVATAWLTVVIGNDAFDARVSIPLADVPLAREPEALSASALVAMGDAPLAVPLVTASCLADRRTLSSLRPGDVFAVPRFPLVAKGGVLAGPVAIVTAAAERGLLGHLGEDGHLVLGSGDLASFPWDRTPRAPIEEAMSAEPNPTLEVLEDAPVVVRVELGVVEMKARAWASLAPGDVVTLGRKLGDPAILRVAGVEVARGELVQVDGEYGVRILGRAGGRG
ncbi:MAG TPA: FliM/FliN family flagellar motor switch protein [Labilithrix sp.]|nr:FliM/FliN family flagellar motor switch protein [Labilithrix sp.]